MSAIFRLDRLKTPIGIAHRMDDTLERWSLALDAAKHELTLIPLDGPDKQTLRYTRPDADHLQLDEPVG